MLPSKKISQTLIEFAEPLIDELDEGYSKEELEGVLKISAGVWNACVVDQWHGTTQFVDAFRQQASASQDPLFVAVVEALIARKLNLFGNDPRAITNEHAICKDGQLVVRAEARLDVQHMTVDGRHAH